MLRHVFFDLYGTLVDIDTDEASPDTAAAFERFVAQRFGEEAARREREHPFLLDLRAIRPAPVLHAEPDLAPTVEAHLRLLLGRAPTRPEVEQLAEGFRAASRRRLTLVPGAIEALAALRARFGVGLISNAQLLFTRPELRQVGLDVALFDPLLISGEEGVRKPSRHIFGRALARAGVRADEALHVGNDPVADVEGAAQAGLRTCLVDDGLPHQEPSVDPSLSLGSVAELPGVLLGQNAPAWVTG